MKLLFICTGNVCRSLMAERLALQWGQRRGLAVESRSCGIAAERYFAPPPEVWQTLAQDGLAPSPHQARLVSRELLAWSDMALTMTARQRAAVLDMFPEFHDKVALLRDKAGLAGDIEDPIGKPLAAYHESRKLISEALAKLLRGA